VNINIASYCRLTNHKHEVNDIDIQIQKTEASSLNDIYRHLNLSYPKFFKMDNLSKAGFLASELLLKNIIIDKETPKKDMAIVLMNRSASLDNDRTYQTTIQDENNFFPSPSVFVYTLSNIVNGEIAIRNKIMGESSFYISENFSPEKIYSAVMNTFSDPNINQVICGWVDYEFNECDVLLLLIRKENQEKIPFNVNNIYHLYT